MSTLKFLVDANIGTSIIRFLQSEGLDVASVTDIDARMPDEEVIKLANREGRILITTDKDFGDLVFNRGLPHKGVIRLEDARPSVQIQYLKVILRKHAKSLPGSFIVAQRGTIRVR